MLPDLTATLQIHQHLCPNQGPQEAFSQVVCYIRTLSRTGEKEIKEKKYKYIVI